ncbi:MAG: NAD-dependent malic enzyme, partial [Oscillospiraceae bacterium]|nr:NAD-dependent malic enzyme [Oscillospiraceae bacterium]
AFPGVFKGALAVRAKDINEEMKLAAAYAIAESVDESKLDADNILPNPFDRSIPKAVAKAVAEAAIKSGIAKKKEFDI